MYSIIPTLRTSKKRGFVQLRLYSKNSVVYFKTSIIATETDISSGAADHWQVVQEAIKNLQEKVESIPNYQTMDAQTIRNAITDHTAKDISFNLFALKYLAEIEKRGAKRTDVMWTAVKSLTRVSRQ